MSLRTSRIATFAALLLAVAGVHSAAAQGQAGNAVTGTVRVTAEVPAILVMSALHVTDVQQQRTAAQVQSRLTVRGNVAYQLSVRANAPAPERGRIEVRGTDGTWMPLPASEPLIVASGEAGESQVDVQCRVSGGTAAARIGACGLTYELASRERAFAQRTQAVLAVNSVSADTVVLARAGY